MLVTILIQPLSPHGSLCNFWTIQYSLPSLTPHLATEMGLLMVFSIDASRGVRHLSCCHCTVADGPARLDFRHHLLPSREGEVTDFLEGVLLEDMALSEFSACSALANLVTLLVLGLVLVTGLLGAVVGVDAGPSRCCHAGGVLIPGNTGLPAPVLGQIRWRPILTRPRVCSAPQLGTLFPAQGLVAATAGQKGRPRAMQQQQGQNERQWRRPHLPGRLLGSRERGT